MGVADSVENRNGPEPRREPRVEHVLVLPQVGELQRRVPGLGAGLFEGLFGRGCDDEASFGEVPRRDALSPPQLARDAPVLDVLHPVAVGVPVLFGHEADGVLHDGARCGLGELLHREEPLHREFRLDGDARALRIADVVGVLLGLFEEPGGIEVLLDPAADIETVLSDVQADLVVDRAVVVEDVDGFQSVFFPEHVVVDVVRRGHFQGSGAELDVDILVADDGDRASDERHDDAGVGREVLIARVVGVDAEARIAEDGLGTGRGDDDRALRSLDLVAQVVELSVRLLEDDLLVGEGGLCGGVPVDHADAAVDLTLVVEVAEDAQDALRADVVHREAGAVPVARGAELAQLPEDDAAVLLLPLPGVFQEFVTRERRLLDSLFAEHGDDFGLRGDRGVVHAGDPACVLSGHAGAADENVLQGVVEHVPHVEHSGDVGGRDDDRIWFAFIGFRVEELVVDPIVVPFGFDLLRSVFVSDLHNALWVLKRVSELFRGGKVINNLSKMK